MDLNLKRLIGNDFNKKYKTNPNKKIGIAFGGGGAKAFAHIGAIKAFEEFGIKFDYVSGTSAGSIVGALYAAGLGYEKIYDIAKTIKMSDLRNSKLFFRPSRTDAIEKVIEDNIQYENIEDLPIPFAACAVDLKTTKEVALTDGSLKKAVAASCALPGIFHPVQHKNMNLADGGIHNTIPASIPKKKGGCDYVVGIDVNSTRGRGTESSRLSDVLFCVLGILLKNSASAGYEESDIMVRIDTKEHKMLKIKNFEDLVEAGYKATMDNIDQIMELFAGRELKNKNNTSQKLGGYGKE